MNSIKLYDLILYFMWIALFKITAVPHGIQQMMKVSFVLFVVIYIVYYAKQRRYWLNIVSLYGVIILLSSIIGYFKRYIEIDSIMDACLYTVCLVSLYIIIQYGVDRGYERNIIQSLYNVLFIYVVLSIIYIIRLGGSSSTRLIYYFAGNKFSTSYYFILFAIVFAIKYNVPKKKKIMFALLTVAIIYICYYIKCSTSFVASLLLPLIYFRDMKLARILGNKICMTISMYVSAVIVLFIELILKNSYIDFFIVNILGENVRLTGRLAIYEYLLYVISQSPFWGYGYGNEAIKSVVGYGNAQNGVFQIIVQFGAIGACIWGVMYWNAVKYKEKTTPLTWPLCVYIYIMIVCAIVEIPFNYMFYSVLFMLLSVRNKVNREEERVGYGK